MKKATLITLLFLNLLLICGCDSGEYSGTFIFEGIHTYRKDDRLPGDLFIRAGTAELTAGSQVGGSIYLLGGELSLNGTVAGNLVIVDGTASLGPETVVGGDLRVAGGRVTQAETAVIRGDILQGSVAIPADLFNPERGWDDVARLSVAGLLLAGWAALLAQRQPQAAIHLGDAIICHPLPTGALGVLVLLVLPALLVVMAFTIVLLPLVLVVGLLLFLLMGYGLAALGIQLGLALQRLTRQTMPPWLAAFAGTLLLFTLLLAPVLGELLSLVSAVFIAGALLLTGFGMRPFTPAWPAADSDPSEYRRLVP